MLFWESIAFSMKCLKHRIASGTYLFLNEVDPHGNGRQERNGANAALPIDKTEGEEAEGRAAFDQAHRVPVQECKE